MVEKTFFVIVFVGRQGSSFLEGLLNSHPDARCEGEIFSPTGNYFSACGHRDVGRYLEEFLHADPHRAVGFKMPWVSLLDHPEAWDVLERLGYRLIHLTRDNLLDQYISMMLAKLNNAWRSDFGKTKIKRFHADFEQAEFHFRSWAGQDEMLRRVSRSYPSIHITYEQLVGGEGVAAALDFLDLKPVPLKSRFKRQRSGSQSEIIENYAEMKAHFTGTEWARHFVDTVADAGTVRPDAARPAVGPARPGVLSRLKARVERRLRS